MLAMVLYPEVQKKNQEELDTVVGRSRMPTFADMEYLPYLQATVREALRWHPIDPVGKSLALRFGLFEPDNYASLKDFLINRLKMIGMKAILSRKELSASQIPGELSFWKLL